MPTYDYTCEACGYEEERFLPISAAPAAVRCPKCQAARKLRKVIKGAAVSSGVVIPGCRVKYPYVDWQLPDKNGKPLVVQSRAHLREVAAGAYNGERYEIDAI